MKTTRSFSRVQGLVCGKRVSHIFFANAKTFTVKKAQHIHVSREGLISKETCVCENFPNIDCFIGC